MAALDRIDDYHFEHNGRFGISPTSGCVGLTLYHNEFEIRKGIRDPHYVINPNNQKLTIRLLTQYDKDMCIATVAPISHHNSKSILSSINEELGDGLIGLMDAPTNEARELLWKKITDNIQRRSSS